MWSLKNGLEWFWRKNKKNNRIDDTSPVGIPKQSYTLTTDANGCDPIPFDSSSWGSFDDSDCQDPRTENCINKKILGCCKNINFDEPVCTKEYARQAEENSPFEPCRDDKNGSCTNVALKTFEEEISELSLKPAQSIVRIEEKACGSWNQEVREPCKGMPREQNTHTHIGEETLRYDEGTCVPIETETRGLQNCQTLDRQPYEENNTRQPGEPYEDDASEENKAQPRKRTIPKSITPKKRNRKESTPAIRKSARISKRL